MIRFPSTVASRLYLPFSVAEVGLPFRLGPVPFLMSVNKAKSFADCAMFMSAILGEAAFEFNIPVPESVN